MSRKKVKSELESLVSIIRKATSSTSKYLDNPFSGNDDFSHGLDLTVALQVALQKALEHHCVAHGLRESIKAFDRRQILEI
jgi:hypothetical protein